MDLQHQENYGQFNKQHIHQPHEHHPTQSSSATTTNTNTLLQPSISLPDYQIDYGHILQQQLDFYQVQAHSLVSPHITKQNRAKLKIWLGEELAKDMYVRETYALTSKYLDLYMGRDTTIKINSFQTLGLACFVLAAKVIEHRSPAISFDVFDKKEILNFEKKILFALQFKVLPLTYVSLAQVLLTHWEKYMYSNEINYHVPYFQRNLLSVQRFRSFLEILDCIDLVPESAAIETSSLVISIFFFEHRINCIASHHPRSFEEAIDIWTQEDEYKDVFVDFFRMLTEKCDLFAQAEIDEKVLKFILPFLHLKTRQGQPKLNVSPFRPPYTIMTFNQGSYNLVKKIMKKSQ